MNSPASPEPPTAHAPPPVIDFRGVERVYPGPPPVTALRPADLRIERGEFVTVVGPSGSGKSTFLNVTGLLDRPTAGTYLLDGINTAVLGEDERTALRGRRLGFVFQSFHLLPYRSAVENVMLAQIYTNVPRKQRRTLATETLAKVGLSHRVDATTAQMSGGERQRVAIARALVCEPSLLLCDEPTGNLDSANAERLLQLLETLHGAGMTLVVVTHDPIVAARGQRTVVVRDGVLSESSASEASR